MKSYVLIITDDYHTAQLVTAEDWNKLPIEDRVEIILLADVVSQTTNPDIPENNDELAELINNSIPITNAEEEIC